MSQWFIAGAILAGITAATLHQTRHLKEAIMSAQQEAVDAIVAQLDKAQSEILSAIDDLEAQIDAGQPADLTALKAAAQSLDDLNPDDEPHPDNTLPDNL